MTIAELFRQYLEHLFYGKRAQAREVILAAQDRGITSEKLLKMVIWPAMEQVEELHRKDRIPRITERMATRINRMVADQLQGYLRREAKTGRRMVVICGSGGARKITLSNG